MAVLERDVEILCDPHLSGAALAFSVAGNPHEVQSDVPLDGPRQIGQEEAGAFENADELERSGGVIGSDLAAKFFDAALNFVGWKKNAKRRVGHQTQV